MIKACFDNVIGWIKAGFIEYANEILKKESIDHIIVVGGFSNSRYFKEEIASWITNDLDRTKFSAP